MTLILLTGAGFSRNWGGWLAVEAFEYLLGSPEIDEGLRDLLWRHQEKGTGFEGALADLQRDFTHRKDETSKKALDGLQTALVGMFNEMNAGLSTIPNFAVADHTRSIRSFLDLFDAIFTLNQDLLLEQHYCDATSGPGVRFRWRGAKVPGVRPINPTLHIADPRAQANEPCRPDQSLFNEQTDYQPYYKLHGSSNWVADTGDHLLIMGGAKVASISMHPILDWYAKQFQAYLSRPNVRLVVIGYSFSDDHINEAIMAAAANGLKLFIIDPAGAMIIDKRSNAGMIQRLPEPLMETLKPCVAGASRRPLSAIFGSDTVEHGKVMRFIKG